MTYLDNQKRLLTSHPSAPPHLRRHLRDRRPGRPEVVVILLGRELMGVAHRGHDGPGKVDMNPLLDALPHALYFTYLVHLGSGE